MQAFLGVAPHAMTEREREIARARARERDSNKMDAQVFVAKSFE